MTNDDHVWVVFDGHGYYFDSVWTDPTAAEARARHLAKDEGSDWEANPGRYLRRIPLNRTLTEDEYWGRA